MRKYLNAIAILFLLIQISCSPSKDKDLNAKVGVSGSIVEIKNDDQFDYTNCKLTLNDSYELTGIEIKKGESVKIFLTDFTDETGVRFGTNQKALSLEIWCEIPDGGHGFYLGDWK